MSESSRDAGYAGYGSAEYRPHDYYRDDLFAGSESDRVGYASTAEGGVGHYCGRGPKGYRRSDERIREDVCEYLTDDDRIDASNIDVTVRECEVTLAGSVNSREEKRRAEHLIERLSGVRDVFNQLRIVDRGQ